MGGVYDSWFTVTTAGTTTARDDTACFAFKFDKTQVYDFADGGIGNEQLVNTIKRIIIYITDVKMLCYVTYVLNAAARSKTQPATPRKKNNFIESTAAIECTGGNEHAMQLQRHYWNAMNDYGCTAAINNVRTDFRRRVRPKPVLFLMHPKTGADRLEARFPRNTCLRNDKIFTTRLTAAAGARVSNGIIYNEP